MERIIIIFLFLVGVSFPNCSKHLVNSNWLILHLSLGGRLAFSGPFLYKIKLNLPTEPQILSLKPKSVEWKSKAWISECDDASFLGIKKVDGERETSFKKFLFFFTVRLDKVVIVRALREWKSNIHFSLRSHRGPLENRPRDKLEKRKANQCRFGTRTESGSWWGC